MNPAPPQVRIAIVGAGFAGLCMAIRLQQSGQNDFVIIERGATVGGTWRDNSYPGAACDIPSHLYSLSFEQNAGWSRKYPTQAELYAYLRDLAEKYRLLAKIRFNSELLGADYDDGARRWRLRTGTGELTAQILVLATGSLCEPRLPDIPGIERFAGRRFHSSRWDHDFDLAGKRVAVIGTGASAIQFVPEIAPVAAALQVYQRTPSWIIPRPDRPITRVERFLLRRVKPLQWLYRWLIYWTHESRVLGFVLHPGLMKLFQKLAERHLRQQVADPELRRRLTPGYVVGCKRVLISNDWYPALQRPNVEVIDAPIREVREHSVVTADGRERAADALILATGFYATDNPIAGLIRGSGGRTLAQAWQHGEEAYLGSLVHGFPSLFFIVGPNTVLGHSSMVFMIETQVEYILRCLALMQRENATALEVRQEVQAHYNETLQQRLRGSVWATGCKSWYQHSSGKITALWPGFTFSFWRRTRKFEPADYSLQP